MVFPAESQQVSTGGGFTPNQLLISLQVHDTILTPVPEREQSPFFKCNGCKVTIFLGGDDEALEKFVKRWTRYSLEVKNNG
jgi:hypothetical protein